MTGLVRGIGREHPQCSRTDAYSWTPDPLKRADNRSPFLCASPTWMTDEYRGPVDVVAWLRALGAPPEMNPLRWWSAQGAFPRRSIIRATIGLGSVGCQDRYASRGSCGHSMSMSTLVPGCVAPASTVSAVRSTRRCMARSCGMPKAWPNGNSTPTMRGAPSAEAIDGIIVTTTVGTPAASRRRASTGTFRQQSGQAGASTTPLVCCSVSSRVIAGAVISRQPFRSP